MIIKALEKEMQIRAARLKEYEDWKKKLISTPYFYTHNVNIVKDT